jgi:class 3 adenylate cyclase
MVLNSKHKKVILSILFIFFCWAFWCRSAASDPITFQEKIIINNDSILIIPVDETEKNLFFRNGLKLSRRLNNISFEFNHTINGEFRFYLEGFDKKWTSWSNKSFKEYTNLPAGKYAFHSEYRFEEEKIEVLPLINIDILPIWYFSLTAIIFYVITFMLLMWALYEQLNLRFARTQYMLEQIINNRTEDLIREKEKSDNLLANVLPKETASEIMSKGKAAKIKYNFVTVLFSDIQGFTKIAEEMNPEVLIDELDKFFFHFDSVVEKYGIEKIKTIGDAYMCAGGIPEKNRTNPVEVILAALEMKTYMKNLKESSELQGMKYWDIRIGIHTGTVIAGVVGHKKLTYDIWGDTVNTASRMESSGEAAKINISGTTYEFVRDFFDCEFRGKMPVKYKGELEMYFVDGIKEGLCNEDGTPNKEFILKLQSIRLLDIEEVIIKMFDDEASPDLYFHNSALVRSISNHVELLSTAEKLPFEEYIHLKLASVFLFTGYIIDYEKPLEGSIRILNEILPRYGFTQTDAELAAGLIKNSFNENYETLSDKILHDARYDYLGRVDYIKLTERLWREKAEHGKNSVNKIDVQKKLLSQHEFLTSTASMLRSVSIDEQLASLESK